MKYQILRDDLTASLKAGEKQKAETLRFVLAALKNYAIDKYGPDAETKLTDQDVDVVVGKQAKSRRESIDAFSKAGRDDLVAKEQSELSVIELYLPKQLSDDELEDLLTPVAAAHDNFGRAMSAGMQAVRGKADGARVAGVLQRLMKSQ